MLAKVHEAARVHQARLAASLSESEQEQLTRLLRRIARDQGITGERLPGIRPRRR
jgi:type II secretory pathway component PulM